MKIHPVEIIDGLDTLIQEHKSIAYITQLSIAEPVVLNPERFKGLDLARATNQNQIDLYYLQSILVTTNWNKNDDVFTPLEVWKARHTPEDKPLNLEHDPDQILGHITDCWAVDADLKQIDDSTEEDKLPDKFHIITSAVIYKNWHKDQNLTEMVDEVLEGIQAGTYYVSMECLLRDFAYAVENTNGKVVVIDRTPDTAYLTKYLRVYGGKGVYQGKKIGRVVRDIVFSGKALVEHPANPESVIFPEVKKIVASNNFNISEKLVYKLSNENSDNSEIVMSDPVDTFKILKEENDGLKASLAETKNLVKQLEENLKKVDSDAVNAKITNLENEIKVRDEKISALEKSASEYKSVSDVAKTELETANSKVTELSTKLAEIEKASKVRARVEKLVSVGVAADEATAKVEKFASLADEQFEEIVKICTKPVTASTQATKADEVIATAEPTKNSVENVIPTKASVDDMEELRKDFNNYIKSTKSDGVKV